MIEYRLLNKEGLQEFINSSLYINLKNLPITKHRAISQINNPRAEKDDVLLILALSGNEVVGYLGILPDRVFIMGKESCKYGCLTCFWINSSLRGKGIGEQLLRKSLELYDNKVLLANFIPSTKKVYMKTGAFSDSLVQSGIKLYVRMDLQTILPPKKSIFQKLKPVLKFCDAVINTFADLRFHYYSEKYPSVKLEYVNLVDEETREFISRMQDYELFKRGFTELNWILLYPWILSSPVNDFTEGRYYFSSTDKEFGFCCLKVRDESNQLVAFLIFSKRNRMLKLPYCYFEKEAVKDVVKIIRLHILKWRINTFFSLHPELSAYLSAHKTPGLFKKKTERRYIVSNNLNELISANKYLIQDGDGDSAFT